MYDSKHMHTHTLAKCDSSRRVSGGRATCVKWFLTLHTMSVPVAGRARSLTRNLLVPHTNNPQLLVLRVKSRTTLHTMRRCGSVAWNRSYSWCDLRG